MKDKIILGSQSPRRKVILEEAGFDVQILLADIEENYPDDIEKADVPEYLAKLKMQHLPCNLDENIFIITADTMLLFKDKLIGKPENTDEAFNMLSELNDTFHEVITGVCIKKNNKTISFSQKTKVYFKKMNLEEIKNFIDTHIVLDKAGAYNIQEYIGVDKIEGDFDNVAGLPIQTILEKIKNWNNL
ncbi:MAG TPA: Maf family nucleotide pyrophosphatase [Chitinophagales bacterium]|nr:Maf family nucleotide pyrophosphatase [Chitinophagales bacterium]HMU97527.1 Maf family nucleotide pyrophosphatase [Chitinophagales bacterium]HMV03503.1 Maf family nucleotide pyrophosphatase [Chitinophagales bacterium]HMW94390.1 Maf family nucleotide pyrophosphatase [Chitinophagales bacterium]HMY42242.1 Maf family nucleotide pyrophosphatase [Chitinophagales bacterium]